MLISKSKECIACCIKNLTISVAISPEEATTEVFDALSAYTEDMYKAIAKFKYLGDLVEALCMDDESFTIQCHRDLPDYPFALVIDKTLEEILLPREAES